MHLEPFSADRRVLAAKMCHLLAHGAEDTTVPLEHLGRIAQQIAAFLLDADARDEPPAAAPRLRVIQGGRL